VLGHIRAQWHIHECCGENDKETDTKPRPTTLPRKLLRTPPSSCAIASLRRQTLRQFALAFLLHASRRVRVIILPSLAALYRILKPCKVAANNLDLLECGVPRDAQVARDALQRTRAQLQRSAHADTFHRPQLRYGPLAFRCHCMHAQPVCNGPDVKEHIGVRAVQVSALLLQQPRALYCYSLSFNAIAHQQYWHAGAAR